MSISSTLVHRADIRFHEAADVLRPFVGCFWVMTAQRDATIRLVADGSTTISIQLQSGQAPEWFLRGPLVRPDERRLTGEATLVGIKLRPGVAFLLSRTPAHTMVGRRIAASDMPAFRDFVEEPLRPLTPERCIDVLQRFLVQRLADASVHGVVTAALDEINRKHGCIRRAVAARCHELTSPVSSDVRLGRLRRRARQRDQVSVHAPRDGTRPRRTAAALATDNGYFDRAHLTLDASIRRR
jgi:hypothetical protein